jgi:hypothetical protein
MQYKIKQILPVNKEGLNDNIIKKIKSFNNNVLHYFTDYIANIQTEDRLILFDFSPITYNLPTLIKHAIKLVNNEQMSKLSIILIKDSLSNYVEKEKHSSLILKLEDIKIEKDDTIHLKEQFKASKIDLKNMFSPEV